MTPLVATKSRATPSRREDDQLLELAADLRLVVARLARRLRQHADAGLTPSLLSAIGTIERLAPLTLGELAAAERVQPPTVTRHVSRLEELGLVIREVDRSDRRVTRLQLSPLGRRAVEQTRSRRTAYLARRLRQLGRDDRAVLRRAVGILERLLGERP